MQRASTILEAVGFAAESLGGSSWDSNVHAVLPQLASAADVSRVYIFQNHVDGAGKLLTSQKYEWVKSGISSQRDNPVLQGFSYRDNGFSRWLEALSEGRVIHGLIQDFPASERPLLEAQDIFALIVVPIFVGSEWWGFMGFDDCASRRVWGTAELEAIKAAANIFGAALQRRRMGELEERLVHLATFDDLTGLPNRRALRDFMEREHARAVRRQRPYCIALLDLDRFKLINDTFGHAVGDRALAALGSTVKECVRFGDWVGRWGGEEFVCFLPETDAGQAIQIMERLRSRVESSPVLVAGHSVELSVSIGVASNAGTAETLEAVLARADAALYQAKREGRNRTVAAEHALPVATSLASLVQSALGNDRIRAAYQPIVSVRTGETVAEETLARIIDEQGHVIEAAEFIEAAGRLQLLHRIDELLIRRSLDRCAQHLASGAAIGQFVNVSADLLRHPDLVRDLLACAEVQYAVCSDGVADGKPLIIEITERELLGDVCKVRDRLAPFLDFGIRLALDDFGGAYSSFNYLAHLPVSFLKIEVDLIKFAKSESRVRTIIRHIQNIAQDLALTTVAEGVEDQATAEILKGIGVDLAQGAYFGSPSLS